jgi:hypothetical protein
MKMYKIYNYYICTAYILLISSIGANIANIKILTDFDIKNIQELRSLFPILILFINSLIIITKFRFNFFKNLTPVLLIFLLITIVQFVGLLLNHYNVFYLQFMIGTLSLISLFIILWRNNNEDIFSKLFSLNFYLIILLVIVFIYQNPNITYGSGWINIFGHQIININSNGFSRYLLFLYIFLYVDYILLNKINFYKTLILLTISTLIFLYEGRFNIGILLIINLIIFLKKINFLKKILLYLFISIIPLTCSTAWQNYLKNNNYFDFWNSPTFRTATNGEKYNTKKEHILSYSTINNMTTGRYEKWKIILEYEQSIANKILGNGPEFDRSLLNKYNKYSTGSDSANAILYIYLSGGILSVIFFLLLIMQQFKKIWKNFVMNNLQNYLNNSKIFISIIYFMYILIRSLFENSFSVWSIDQVFFILFSCYWNFFLDKRNSVKN